MQPGMALLTSLARVGAPHAVSGSKTGLLHQGFPTRSRASLYGRRNLASVVARADKLMRMLSENGQASSSPYAMDRALPCCRQSRMREQYALSPVNVSVFWIKSIENSVSRRP